MPPQPQEKNSSEPPSESQAGHSALSRVFRGTAGRSRLFITGSGVLVCVYALGVICCVLSVPDIGVRCAFSTKVDHFNPEFLAPGEQQPLQTDDEIVRLGGHLVENWAQYLRALAALRKRSEPAPVKDAAELNAPGRELVRLDGEEFVRVEFERDGQTRRTWCRLGHSPLAALVPTVLWFFIKAGLFLVGALVFWTRPQERSARLFFVLCLVSCGAYLGGYHWQSITTRPPLLVVFMVSAVLLPAVSLHFYLLFPRPKSFFERRPLLTLVGVYSAPLLFLGLLLTDYLYVRVLLGNGPAAAGGVEALLRVMLWSIYGYFLIALGLYFLSLWALLHGYRTAQNVTERNQVKWILIGATAALVPLLYSLYLALLDQTRFVGGGAATWPMFGASLCVTLAFTISITRYRLMQVDQIVSSGFIYVAISVVAAAVYYALVFGGVLLLGSRISGGPSLAQAAGVSATVLLLLVVLDAARGRLKKVLDRHFRREKLHLDRTLRRMSQAVAQLVDAPTLARSLLHSTADLLGVERGAVYLREGEPALYRLAAVLGDPPRLPVLPPGQPLVEELRSHGNLSPHPSHANGNGAAHDTLPALRQLRSLGGEVAFALVHEERMLALLVLGPKSGGPYMSEDLNLLSAFAQVTVLALVSGEGGRTIEALNRELQAKVEKIAEQQRRILALQSQLTRRQRASEEEGKSPEPGAREEKAPEGPSSVPSTPCVATPEPPVSAEIIGTSPTVSQLLYQVRKVAAASSPVLLRGESGTGKDLLARALHENSPRAGRPFVKVHCAALQQTLLESELFGHVKGAYTGAVSDRQGRFELAHGGTLFLDEIGDISWEVQTKLLRVLQEMTFERVGSSEPIQVDVRIIAATHQDLERLIRQGRFREDLFYRLNVLPIHVPPLRQRREDIAELVQHFLRYHGQRCGKNDMQIDDDALALLKAALWPGNVRQLGSVIERAVVIAEGQLLTVADLPAELLVPPAEEGLGDEEAVETAPVSGGAQAERVDRDRREREQLVRALTATSGNKAEAARLLGLARSTFLSRLKKHGLS
jgi:transcriptional regulator with GAF, ATPase, and Fis domain